MLLLLLLLLLLLGKMKDVAVVDYNDDDNYNDEIGWMGG